MYADREQKRQKLTIGSNEQLKHPVTLFSLTQALRAHGFCFQVRLASTARLDPCRCLQRLCTAYRASDLALHASSSHLHFQSAGPAAAANRSTQAEPWISRGSSWRRR